MVGQVSDQQPVMPIALHGHLLVCTQYVVKYALTVCLHILGFVLPDDHFGRFLSDDQPLFCALNSRSHEAVCEKLLSYAASMPTPSHMYLHWFELVFFKGSCSISLQLQHSGTAL